MKRDIKKVKNVVRDVLREDVRARNSDKWLTIQVLRKMGIKIYLDYSQLKDMPSFESIRRARQKIQNEEGKYRADEEVESFRDEEEKKMESINVWGER